MKAAVVHGPGQTPVYGDFAEPTPAEGESRIKVTAAALSQLAKARAIGRALQLVGRVSPHRRRRRRGTAR